MKLLKRSIALYIDYLITGFISAAIITKYVSMDIHVPFHLILGGLYLIVLPKLINGTLGLYLMDLRHVNCDESKNCSDIYKVYSTLFIVSGVALLVYSYFIIQSEQINNTFGFGVLFVVTIANIGSLIKSKKTLHEINSKSNLLELKNKGALHKQILGIICIASIMYASILIIAENRERYLDRRSLEVMNQSSNSQLKFRDELIGYLSSTDTIDEKFERDYITRLRTEFGSDTLVKKYLETQELVLAEYGRCFYLELKISLQNKKFTRSDECISLWMNDSLKSNNNRNRMQQDSLRIKSVVEGNPIIGQNGDTTIISLENVDAFIEYFEIMKERIKALNDRIGA